MNHVSVLILDSRAMAFSSNGLRITVVVVVAAEVSSRRRKDYGDEGNATSNDATEDDNDTSLDFIVDDNTSISGCECLRYPSCMMLCLTGRIV